jgi:transposase
MKGFRQVEIPRQQMVLWSHSLEEAVAVDHPVRLFERILKSGAFAEVFSALRREYVLVEGRPPFAPADLTGLYLYGMLNGIRSSRQLEGACYNRLDVIWLMQGQTPDHCTIAGFVSRHGKHLKKLFRQTIQVALSAGLVKLGHVSVDGTKIEADAGKGSVKSQSWLEAEKAKMELELDKLEGTAGELEKEWSANEGRERLLWSEQSPGNSRETPQQRREAFEKERQKLDAALRSLAQRAQASADQGGKEPKAIVSLTDPEARVMPDKQGKSKPGYNAQIAVDAQAGVILAQAVNDRPEDVGQLVPMLEQVKEQTGSLPAECSADSGYNSGEELAQLEAMNVIGFLPDAGQNGGVARAAGSPGQLARAEALAAAHRGEALSPEQWQALPRTQGLIDKSAFTYEPDSDTYRCPAGVSLPVLRHSRDRKNWGVAHRFQYGGSKACATCPHAAGCCRNPARGRTVNRDQYEPHRQRTRERMATAQGKARYRLRGQTVEPRFGMMKAILGVRRFMRRTLEKVRVEFSLLCTAMNLKVLMREWAKVEAVLPRA